MSEFNKHKAETTSLIRIRPLLHLWIAAFLSTVTLMLALSGPFATLALADEGRVVVVRQRDDKNSKRLIRGIKSVFKRSGQSATLEVITVSDIQPDTKTLLDSLHKLNPSIIVPLGSHITRILSDSISSIPIVFGAVLQPKASGFIRDKKHPKKQATGASLDIPPALQFKYFKRIFPKLRELGVIYSDETANIIPHAKIVAEASGIILHAVKIEAHSGRSSGREVKKALDSLLPIVDGLWSLADPSVFSPISTKLVIKRTLKQKIPFMGFSSTIVASGALFALDFDYKDIGRQVGELSNKILSGADPNDLPVTTPDIVWFHYNENTSVHVAIVIPEELRAVAKEVYK